MADGMVISSDQEALFTSHADAFALVVSGPSGVGKTSVCKTLIDRDDRIKPVVTTTTRPRRNGETDGIDYHFVTGEQYDALLSEDAFLEHATVHGLCYGTTREAFRAALECADIVVVEIDVQGAQTLRDALVEHCVSVFILPPSLEELSERLAGRNSEDRAELKVRTENAKNEMVHAPQYDYVIVNHELAQAIGDIECIVCSERCRPARQRTLLDSLNI